MKLLQRKMSLAVMLAITLATSAQQKAPRKMQYTPQGRYIVCVNGNNRYTRSLYGTHTLYRLETSDRPIFATYDNKNGKNIRFYLTYEGRTTQLDSTTWCEARYQGGLRSYTLRDDKWGKGELQLNTLASQYDEGAIWQFTTTGFKGKVQLSARMCQTRKVKMERFGDLGMTDIRNYDPSPDEKGLQTLQWNGLSDSYVQLVNNQQLQVLEQTKGRNTYQKEEKARLELVNLVEFTTPDPYINTLGTNLVAAADGLWDGETWLHGCIGWRMPLVGWRAAYVADALGWQDRAVKHFDAYAASQVTNIPATIPHPSQDTANNLARAVKKWGTQMYSNGYICRNPHQTNNMNHYDMNLNYIDELLWHFQYDADTTYMRKMWPVIKLHLEWEKRNFDPDNDHLYDAYCCIWASDALYYNSGAVTHSSAYNYRGNKLAARIAEIIGEDPTPYNKEADAILAAMNQRLWLNDEGHWAEFQDFMGKKRLHKSAALWTIYTPIDCGACTPEQAYQATVYVDKNIPHIPVLTEPQPQDTLYTLSTSDWMPYDWSTNNVAQEEVSNMALAYFQAGRTQSGYNLLKAEMMDAMYLGQCPGNFGQISYLDKSRSEAYRDFGDGIGIFSRTLINGLFGINPQALYGKCILKPAFPESWDSASIRTPYLSYEFHRQGNLDIYHIRQHFTRPLQMLVQANAGGGAYLEVKGNSDEEQTITIDRNQLPKSKTYPGIPSHKANVNVKEYLTRMGLDEPSKDGTRTEVKMDKYFNANVDDIFKNKYLSPRSPYTTLEIPTQGVSEWCVPTKTAYIEDDGLRNKVTDGHYDTQLGITFRTPKEGPNIAYTSLWDNYPDSITIPLKGKARCAYLMMAGSTNNMQSRIDNGLVTATYMDGTTDTLHLENPINWCPIEQAYYVDGLAFWSAPVRPYRIDLLSGKTAREVNCTLKQGAAQMLKMPLTADKKLRSLTVHTLSNDVVIGLMGVTLER
jgi:hypothetical protein